MAHRVRNNLILASARALMKCRGVVASLLSTSPSGGHQSLTVPAIGMSWCLPYRRLSVIMPRRPADRQERSSFPHSRSYYTADESVFQHQAHLPIWLSTWKDNTTPAVLIESEIYIRIIIYGSHEPAAISRTEFNAL